MKDLIQQSNKVRLTDAGGSKACGTQVLCAVMAFMMIFTLYGCIEEPGSGGATRGAVKYTISTGGETAITFDNSKELFRSDTWMSGMHFISITDQKKQVIDTYNPNAGWTTIAYTSGGVSSGDYTFNEANAVKLEKLPDRTIAGKTCKAYKYTHKNGTEYITAEWKGLMMYNEIVATGVTMEATSATLDFPDKAFTQEIIDPTWF